MQTTSNAAVSVVPMRSNPSHALCYGMGYGSTAQSGNMQIRKVDGAGGNFVRDFSGKGSVGCAACLDPAETHIYCAGSDPKVVKRNVADGAELICGTPLPARAIQIAFVGTDHIVVYLGVAAARPGEAGSSGGVMLFHVSDLNYEVARTRSTDIPAGIVSTAVSPCGTTLALALDNGTSLLLDTLTLAVRGMPLTVSGKCLCVAFSADSRMLAVGGNQPRTLRVFDLLTGGQMLETQKGNNGSIRSIAWVSAEQIALTRRDLGGATIRIVNLALGGKCVFQLWTGEYMPRLSMMPDFGVDESRMLLAMHDTSGDFYSIVKQRNRHERRARQDEEPVG